jgi:hypothetical protein
MDNNEIDERYSNGIIYGLYGGGKCYIGSTILTLDKRFSIHKNKTKYGTNNCVSRDLFECDDLEIKLIEKFPCRNKKELLWRERYWQENTDCINKNKPIRENKKEYYEENREQLLASYKKYRELNKDKIIENKKDYREKNKEKISEKMKDYREKNKEKISEKKREYYEKNIEKINQKVKCDICDLELSKNSLLLHKKRKHNLA